MSYGGDRDRGDRGPRDAEASRNLRRTLRFIMGMTREGDRDRLQILDGTIVSGERRSGRGDGAGIDARAQGNRRWPRITQARGDRASKQASRTLDTLALVFEWNGLARREPVAPGSKRSGSRHG